MKTVLSSHYPPPFMDLPLLSTTVKLSTIDLPGWVLEFTLSKFHFFTLGKPHALKLTGVVSYGLHFVQSKMTIFPIFFSFPIAKGNPTLSAVATPLHVVMIQPKLAGAFFLPETTKRK